MNRWSSAGVLLVLLAAPLAAQDTTPEAETDLLEVSGEPGTEPDLGSIDEILEADAADLEGSGFSYEPEDRRDPFKSLLTVRDQPDVPKTRPEGIPGLLIDEIDLTGVFKTGGVWVAQVRAADQDKGYLLHEGDQLYDGDVVAISRSEVVFRQIVRDPTALKPFREVAKKLNP